MHDKNLHWHCLYAIELGSSVFSSVVNIENWLASQLGRSGGKGHVKEVREKESCFLFLQKYFKKKNLKKAEIFELKQNSSQ